MTASMKFLTWRNMFRSRIRKTEPCTSASRYFRPRSHNKVWTIFHLRTSPKEFLPNVVQSHWSTNDKLNIEEDKNLYEIDFSKERKICKINQTARCRATPSFFLRSKLPPHGLVSWDCYRNRANFSHPLLQLFEWKTVFNNLLVNKANHMQSIALCKKFDPHKSGQKDSKGSKVFFGSRLL